MRRYALFLLTLLAYYSMAGSLTVVIDLNEKFLDVSNEGFWIVQFYAPWCAHCKRLLPVWEHLGHAVNDKNLSVRVAKMDCTRFTSVCNILSISGYPTIMFFRQGRKIEYHGERTKEALFNFVVKSSAPVIEKINTARFSDESIKRESRNDPSFVILGDEKDEIFAEFEKTAESLFSKTRFFAATASSVPATLKESSARVVVFKDDAFFPYHGSADGLKDWVMGERWSLMPRASPSNLGDLATTGKLLVLVICSELERFNQSSPIGIFYGKAKDAAEDLRKSPPLWSRYQFAWMDGPELVISIVMGNMDAPSMLVLNYTTYEYFLNEDDPEKVTSSSIITWLSNIADGFDKGTATPLGGRSLLVRIRRFFFEIYLNVTQMFTTQPLLSSVLFGMPIAFLSIICYSICSADFSVDRDEFYPEDEDEDYNDEESESAILVDPSHAKSD
ncbi:Thioredoxin domain-containing protein [Trichostrongylus colubriformis]|uniref:Thioredoxin domain-containing protein n=1 Tax=Trichostrongylus colubriformis TaxID=6319 RepID=A0AAN8EWV0_TRICO